MVRLSLHIQYERDTHLTIILLGEPASKRLTLEQEQKTEREVLMDEVSASLTTEEDKALRAQAFEVMQKESERRLALKDYKGNWSFDRFAREYQQLQFQSSRVLIRTS